MYGIKITNAGSAFDPPPGYDPVIPGAQFCSVINVGRGYENDPSALRVVMQAEIMATNRAVMNGFVRIYGIDKDMIDQAADLTDARVEVYGGFWPGLELATWEAPYMGLLFQGTVNGAFANWKGNEISLEMLLNPGPTKEAPSGDSGVGGGSAAPGASGQSVALPPLRPSRLLARQRRLTGKTRSTPPPRAAQFDDGGGEAFGGLVMRSPRLAKALWVARRRSSFTT